MDHVEQLNQKLRKDPLDRETWGVLADAYFSIGDERNGNGCRYLFESPEKLNSMCGFWRRDVERMRMHAAQLYLYWETYEQYVKPRIHKTL